MSLPSDPLRLKLFLLPLLFAAIMTLAYVRNRHSPGRQAREKADVSDPPRSKPTVILPAVSLWAEFNLPRPPLRGHRDSRLRTPRARVGGRAARARAAALLVR